MLTEIRIAKTASYSIVGSKLDELRPINFIFGTNGTGKTTISRVIHDPDAFPACALTWANNQPVEASVYNRNFIDRNFTPQFQGIFTLGETESDTLEKIKVAKASVDAASELIARFQGTLGLPDNSNGKRAELAVLRTTFEAECWKIKGKHDLHFKDAFTGARNSQSRFCDRVLLELTNNVAPLVEFEQLKSRAVSLFEQRPERYNAIPLIDAEMLVAINNEPVLAKKVVGKEDVDVAALIRRLGNPRPFDDAQSRQVCSLFGYPLTTPYSSQRIYTFGTGSKNAMIGALIGIEKTSQSLIADHRVDVY